LYTRAVGPALHQRRNAHRAGGRAGDPEDGKGTSTEEAQGKPESIPICRFLAARQITAWIAQTFHVAYSDRGVRDLLHRIGASYHKATGFWKADPDKQDAFIRKYERHKAEASGQKTRRYFVDACHPVWEVEMLYCCWLLVGQRLLVGVGGGRNRLNILGAYCPDDRE
jgi:hypothetical protein